MSGSNGGLVVVAVEDVVENVQVEVHTLVGQIADHSGNTRWRKETLNRFGVLDASRVIEGEYTEDVSGLKADTGLLDKPRDAVLGGNQSHVHLHDLRTVS